MEIIKYENIHKVYYKSRTQLRDVLLMKPKKEYHILKGISFDIQQGERAAIIGLNGAGKSTLLKLLSRITVPTSGSLTINGTVASLLEVGAGFHHELTGYQNILLNGVILGMTKKELKSKYQEIIDFSEIHPKYLDMPLSTYSSGMKARLGFSIARLVKTDIIVLDETLSVGDITFRAKSNKAIKDMFGENRTVVFVTHDMETVQRLATKVIWIEQGYLKGVGSAEEILPQYYQFHNIKPKVNSIDFTSKA